jgi:hypothetical protein
MVRVRAVLSTALATLCGATLLTACSSDPTPTGVTLAWASDSRQAVRVGWKDSSAPNRITIEGVLSTSPSYVKYLPPDAPNSWDIPSSEFPSDGNYRIAVAVGTSTGGVTSKPARSEMFDTDGPVRPSASAAIPTGESGQDVLVRWVVPAPPQDFSPDDPLDVTGRPQLYVPLVGRPGEQLQAVGPGTTSTQVVVKDLKPPYLFQLRAQNEWTSQVGAEIAGRTSTTTASVPGAAQFSVALRIRGRAVLEEVSCAAETSCVQQRTTSAGLPVVLLTQAKPRARWTPVGRGITSTGGYFDIPVTAAGTRPYKVTLPLYSGVGSVVSSSTSEAAVTRGVVRVASAGFIGGASRQRGSTVTVYAVVKPAMNSVAMLQQWNPQTKRWNNAKRVRILRGQAVFAFKAARPGIYVFRYVLPSAKLLGRPLYGTTTPKLILSIR